MEKYHIYSDIKDGKRDNREIVVTAILLAIGVNFLSSSIVELIHMESNNLAMLILGFVITILTIIWYSHIRIKEINRSVHIDGFFVYANKSRQIIDIPEYGICNKMVKCLKSAFSENKAMEKLWMESDINPLRWLIEKSSNRRLPSSAVLFMELLEYCVIQKLSTHLSNYFNGKDNISLQNIRESDVPEVLLQNRFLKLFSEDMSNRSIFMCEGRSGSRCYSIDEDQSQDIGNGTTVYATNSAGGLYEKFELILLPKCKISRDQNHGICIKTPIFTMKIHCFFNGCNTVIDNRFLKYYVGTDLSFREYSSYKFQVQVSVKFKMKSIFLKDKKMYYGWVDSFLNALSDYISQDNYFKSINWTTADTIIRCMENTRKSSQ